MVVFLLLVIVAIMLFGGGTVMGVVGIAIASVFGLFLFGLAVEHPEGAAVTAVLICCSLAACVWLKLQDNLTPSLPEADGGPKTGHASNRAAMVWAEYADHLERQMSASEMGLVRLYIAKNDDRTMSSFCERKAKSI